MATDRPNDTRHDESDDEPRADAEEEYDGLTGARATEDSRFGRRSFLRLTTGAAASIAASSVASTAAAETVRHGITFDSVVDAVDDLGMDSSGSIPIDDALESALRSGTLVEFPPGEYLVKDRHRIEGKSRLGIRGTGSNRRDVVFRPPQGAHVRMVAAGSDGADRFLLENVSFDELSDDTSQMSLNLRSKGGTVVRNIEFLGRRPDDSKSGYAMTTGVVNENAVAVYDTVVTGLDEPAVPVDYPNGVEFFRDGPAHEGEVILRNPIIHENNSSATRYNNNSGVITIEGGEFINNQNSSIRFGAGQHPTKVSSATGCYVEIDGSRDLSDAIRLHGSSAGDAGSVYENIDVVWRNEAGRGLVAAPSFGGHGRAIFKNCRFQNENPDTLTVNAQPVSETDDDALVFEGCHFTGDGGGLYAEDRPESAVRGSCFDMPNGSIEGFDTEYVSTSGCQSPGDSKSFPSSSITIVEKNDLTVELSGADSSDSDGDVVAYDWVVGDATYSGETVTHTFPSAGSYSVGLTVEDDDGATGSTSTELTVDNANDLKIQGKGEATEYSFTVDESLSPVEDTIEEWDEVSNTGATGWVTETSDVDEFTFEGEFTTFEFFSGEADVYVDGEQFDPSSV